MKAERLKKVLFTVICLLLVSAIGVVSFAVWDDISDKKYQYEFNLAQSNLVTAKVDSTLNSGGKKLVPVKSVVNNENDVDYIISSKFTVTPANTKDRSIKFKYDTFTLNSVSQLTNETTIASDKTIMCKIFTEAAYNSLGLAANTSVANKEANYKKINETTANINLANSVITNNTTTASSYVVVVYFRETLEDTSLDMERLNEFAGKAIILEVGFIYAKAGI